MISSPDTPALDRPANKAALALTTVDLEKQSPLVLPGLTWEHYLALDEVLEGTGVRLRFLDYHLQIMSPVSESHEERKIHVSCIVEAWCLERDIELFGRGSMTLKIPQEAGGEADESYCIGEKKDRPDLVIEIALTSGGLSKRAFYLKFKVPEIWIWRKDALEVHVLAADASGYERASQSRVLPGIPLGAIQTCATLPSINQAIREFQRLSKQQAETEA